LDLCIEFKIFIFFTYYFAIRNSNNFKTYIQTFYERAWLDIRVRAVPLRYHKFVTLAVNGSSWITNTATFAGSTDVFANFHAEIARSAISRAFKLSRELTVTNGVLRGARSISVFEREIYLVAGKNRIIQHPCYVMNYSDRSRYSINYHRSRSVFLLTGGASCVLQVNRISCSCGISPAQARTESGSQPGPITGMLKLNSDMRRHRDSGNYERLFSITSLLTRSPACDILIHRYKWNIVVVIKKRQFFSEHTYLNNSDTEKKAKNW